MVNLKLSKCFAKITFLKAETSPRIDALKFQLTNADLFLNLNCNVGKIPYLVSDQCKTDRK